MLLNDEIDYTIQLPEFVGPLDLLLRLIEREELDITRIALAQVADQYLAHVRALTTPDPAALSAFLVVAARLLLIKSRALLPRPPAAGTAEQPIDEGEALVQQLREYQRFKQAAALLRARQDQGWRSYARQVAPPLPVLSRPERLNVTLGDMITAVQRRIQLMLPLEPPPVALPAPKMMTVPEMAARLQGLLETQSWIEFGDLLSLTSTRVEVIVALWTVLELLKRRAIVAEQRGLFGAIMIGRGPGFELVRQHGLELAHTAVDGPSGG